MAKSHIPSRGGTMYGAKTSGNRRSSRSYGGSYKSSSSGRGYTPRRKSRERPYSREYNTSWEYGFSEGSGVTNRAPDPSMSMNHAMEFVNLDNYIANMFG